MAVSELLFGSVYFLFFFRDTCSCQMNPDISHPNTFTVEWASFDRNRKSGWGCLSGCELAFAAHVF